MGLSRYLIRAVSQFYFGGRAAWTYPDLWLGLFTATPTGPDDAGTEVGASGYARIHAPDSGDTTTDWLAQALYGNGYHVLNGGAYLFAPVATDVTVAGVGLWDAAGGGNLLLYGALTAPLLWRASRRLRFARLSIVFAAETWLTGPVMALQYVFRQGFGQGPSVLYQPSVWELYALPAPPTLEDYMRDYDPGLPPGNVTVPNDAAHWPIAGGEVTNAAALSFPVTDAAGPDIGWLFCIGRFPAGYYAPYWNAPLTASASARAGERLEIPAGSIRFDEL